ncbi:hypothetical protein CYK37_29070 [Mesorhizobium loti]|nr:hypothetical protein CYK37_29070 [Mesorhizobium loti]
MCTCNASALQVHGRSWRSNAATCLTTSKLSGARIMADSDNTTTLSIVTRSKAIAGLAPAAFSPNNSKAASETLRPTFRVRGGQLMKRPTDFTTGSSAMKRTGARQGLSSSLRAESGAGEQAMTLLARLSEMPAASRGVVAAKQVNAGSEAEAHPVDRHVGRQIAAIRVQSDVSQAQLARSIGISFQQLQKYENARNRVSASMLYEIGRSLGVPVGRFFQGLDGNGEAVAAAALLPADERLEFIASAEGRRLIEGLMQLPPGVRRRVSSLIAALGEEINGPHCS